MTEKDLRKTYNPNYFSVDYILACQTLIPCHTQVSLPKFGFLVPDCQSQDLPAGVDFELPLWAARVMCKPLRTHVSVNLPPGFKEAHRRVIMGEEVNKADLKNINEQYFEVGHLCTSLFHKDAGELAEMLPEVLQQRLLGIGGVTIPYAVPYWASKSFNEEAAPTQSMDLLEHQLYQDAESGSKGVLKWMEPIRTPASPSINPFQSTSNF